MTASLKKPIPRPQSFFYAQAVTLASDFTVSPAAQALYVGTAGDVKVDMLETGTAITFKNVPAGYTIRLGVKTVYSTAHGTTASNIVALS